MHIKQYYDHTAPDFTKWYRVELWSEGHAEGDRLIKTRVVSADHLKEFAEAEL